MSQNETVWRACSSCKKPIALGAKYFVCSVSTCNGLRTGYVFCSVPCFERHLPGARHKDAGAIEKTAPRTFESTPAGSDSSASGEPKKVFVRPEQMAGLTNKSSGSSSAQAGGSGGGTNANGRPQLPREVLVIASRLKEYITARSEYNTSGSVMDVLSDHIRLMCNEAIDNARAEGRKTVMDRDFEFLKNLRK